ncbi:MAG TPA: hypothetical protein ENK43_06105 [Planctomycetes bacterium]|nr:hypothetical protein [Planctomycetota bacterium]
MSASESETMRDRPADCSSEARRIRSLLEAREKELRRLETVLRELESRLGVEPPADAGQRLEGPILPAHALEKDTTSEPPVAPRRDPALIALGNWCEQAGERLELMAAALPDMARRLDQVAQRVAMLDAGQSRLEAELSGERLRRQRLLLLAAALAAVVSLWWMRIFR